MLCQHDDLGVGRQKKENVPETISRAWRAVSVFTVHPVVFLHRVYFLAVELSALKP